MKYEMGSMYENKVWNLVDLPDDRQAIENKWIFQKKIDADSNVTIYKARLIAKGFRQVQGVDYDETFSPVVIVVVLRLTVEMGVGMERQDLSYGEGVHTRFTSSGPSRRK